MDNPSLIEHRAQVANFGRDLLQICGIEFSRTSEVQRQICGAFLFGVVFAYGQKHGLAPQAVHALVITMLKDILGYSAEQAGAFASDLLQATDAGPDDTINSIIHRGIDGYRQLVTSDHDGLRQNLPGIFQALDATYAS